MGDLMTLLAAGGGLAILAVMAVAPLLLDHHRPRARTVRSRPVVLPAQRTPVGDIARRSVAGAAS